MVQYLQSDTRAMRTCPIARCRIKAQHLRSIWTNSNCTCCRPYRKTKTTWTNSSLIFSGSWWTASEWCSNTNIKCASNSSNNNSNHHSSNSKCRYRHSNKSHHRTYSKAIRKPCRATRMVCTLIIPLNQYWIKYFVMWFSKFILFQFDNTFHFFFQSTANMGMHMQQTKAGKLNDNILRFSFEFISESKFYCNFLSFQMTFRQYYHRMTQRQHLLRICWNNSVRMWSKKLKTTVMRLWPIQPPIWTVTDRSNVRRHPQVGGHRTIWKMNRCLKSRISTKPIEKWISTFKWMRSKFKRQFGKFQTWNLLHNT